MYTSSRAVHFAFVFFLTCNGIQAKMQGEPHRHADEHCPFQLLTSFNNI